MVKCSYHGVKSLVATSYVSFTYLLAHMLASCCMRLTVNYYWFWPQKGQAVDTVWLDLDCSLNWDIRHYSQGLTGPEGKRVFGSLWSTGPKHLVTWFTAAPKVLCYTCVSSDLLLFCISLRLFVWLFWAKSNKGSSCMVDSSQVDCDDNGEKLCEIHQHNFSVMHVHHT